MKYLTPKFVKFIVILLSFLNGLAFIYAYISGLDLKFWIYNAAILQLLILNFYMVFSMYRINLVLSRLSANAGFTKGYSFRKALHGQDEMLFVLSQEIDLVKAKLNPLAHSHSEIEKSLESIKELIRCQGGDHEKNSI